MKVRPLPPTHSHEGEGEYITGHSAKTPSPWVGEGRGGGAEWLPNRLIHWLRRLHRDDRGQVLPVLMVAMLALAVFVSLLFNTGQQTIARRQVQDAADAIALSEAAWVARSLNVMAMNQVALTQSFTINVVSSTMLPTLTEGLVKAGKKLEEYIACCETWVGCLACGPAGIDLIARTIIPLVQLYGDALPIVRDSASLARALSDMNQDLVKQFPGFSRELARSLARDNGLGDEPPILYAGHGSQAGAGELGLPVAAETLSDLPTLYLAGTSGTPPSLGLFWNYQAHGYPRGTGPYPLARDSAKAALAPPLDAMAGFPHFVDPDWGSVNRAPSSNGLDRLFAPYQSRLLTQFRERVETVWKAASLARTLPLPPVSVRIFKPKNAPPPVAPLSQRQRNQWSLLAVARRRESVVAAASYFDNAPGAAYAYAQAEVVSDMNYDLYTQQWRAKLVPARLWEDRDQRPRLIEALKDYPAFRDLARRIPDTDWEKVNAH